MERENYLPDQKYEKTGEQILFEQKVFRPNKAFKCKMNDLILWHKSPSDCQNYPKKSLRN